MLSSVAPDNSKRRRLLLVEDHQPTREGLTKLLEGSGYSVLQATNGREGLAEVARHSPDVILLDLFMPVLSGWEFLRAIQTMGASASVPVIVMSSAFGTDTDLPLSGVAAVVSKPCRPADLLAKIDACIAK
jgi:CheY-like chemotaxis protein